MMNLAAGERTYTLRRAVAADIRPIVALPAADQLGATREGADGDDWTAYEHAFAAIDADPAHLLLAVTAPPGGEVVGTMQLSFLPGSPRRDPGPARLSAPEPRRASVAVNRARSSSRA
ncbi:hypothetical protein [Spongiactinospora gelatinilytica]|uniref:hypothetical protein n=1 Tax=Spongiactinospora gelatinilytica TaxID=2666298 RepID=UPI0018F6C163|nr:hypothetical protein [Spongiactinospora gelatinilytica]